MCMLFVIEAAGGDLDVYMIAALSRAVNREVEDRIAQGASRLVFY